MLFNALLMNKSNVIDETRYNKNSRSITNTQCDILDEQSDFNFLNNYMPVLSLLISISFCSSCEYVYFFRYLGSTPRQETNTKYFI